MKLENTLKYRSVWMGLAMLWVVIYHASPEIIHISFFKNIGYGGVDICLFASGIGCYYSLSKNSDIFDFTKRRLKRIFPTYWCFLPFWFLYAVPALKIDFADAIGNIFGVQNFTGKGNAFNWYISAILLFYLIAPYLKKVVDSVATLKMQLLIICILFAFSVPFWESNTLIITITRLPIFYIGMLYAKRCKQGVSLTYAKIALYVLSVVVGIVLLWVAFHNLRDYRWNHGLYWYPFILVAPGVCVCFSCIMMLLEKSKLTAWIITLLSVVGKYSFEIYLVHILIFDSVNYLIKSGDLPNSGVVYGFAVVVIPVACILLNFLTKFITKTLPGMLKSA